MKKTLIIMAMAALVCWLPAQAMAVPIGTFTSYLTHEYDATSGFPASLGTDVPVVVTLNTSTSATVTINPSTSPDLDFPSGGASSLDVELNVNGAFTVASATYIERDGTTVATADTATNISVPGLGTFSLEAYAPSSYPYDLEGFTIVLTNTSGWANAADVLASNSDGYDAAGNLLLVNTTPPTAYVGEDAPVVPIPPTALLLGSGLLGLALLGLRKRMDFQP